MKPEDKLDVDAVQSQVSEQGMSRRRFAKAVAGSGVILTLASKPVMGSNYYCTGSGAMSGNTSSHGIKISCLACTPGYWKTCPNKWPSPYYPYKIKDVYTCKTKHTPTLFASVFGSCAYGSDKTMMYVLQNYNGSRDWHACGALLNAAKSTSLGLSSAYTVSEIIALYKSGAPATTFSSTYSDNLHNCPLPNNVSNYYEAETNSEFFYVIAPDGTETTQVCKCG